MFYKKEGLSIAAKSLIIFNPNYAIVILPDGFDTFKRKLIIAFEHSTINPVDLLIIIFNYYVYVSIP
jgi:hypothetical protein